MPFGQMGVGSLPTWCAYIRTQRDPYITATNGGTIYNDATLQTTNVTLSGNQAVTGGLVIDGGAGARVPAAAAPGRTSMGRWTRRARTI